MRNFGIVSATQRYHIYRSAELGKRGLSELYDELEAANMPFPKTIVYMNAEGYSFPLYFAIDEWKLQSEYGYRFFHPFGFPRTYLDGYDPYHPTDVIDKLRYLGPVGRKYFDLGDGTIQGGIDTLTWILELILDPKNQPVLFHCLGGMHRTGMVAMLIRFMQKMPWERIVSEYHAFNPFPRKENIEFVSEFIKDPHYLKLCDKYSFLLNT